MKVYIIMFLSIFLLVGCSDTSSHKTEVNLFAASSLTGVVKEMKEKIEKEDPSLELVLHFGSSSHLVEQIKRGAEFDLFLSASEWDMDKLVDSGMINPSSVEPFAYNDLVVVTSKDYTYKNLTSIVSDKDIDYVAVGEPKSVPLGRYTYDVLVQNDMWDKLEDYFVYGKNATQVIQYVENGQVDFAFVYGSDARYSGLEFIPLEDSPIIGYPMGISNETSQADAVNLIVKWMMSEKGEQLFSTYGFIEKNS